MCWVVALCVVGVCGSSCGAVSGFAFGVCPEVVLGIPVGYRGGCTRGTWVCACVVCACVLGFLGVLWGRCVRGVLCVLDVGVCGASAFVCACVGCV